MTAINVNFVLKYPKSEQPSLIYCKVYYNRKRFTYSTGKQIAPKYWDFEDQFVKQVRGDKVRNEKHKEINHTLNRYRTEVERVFTYCEYHKINPTTEYLRKELDKEFKTSTEPKEITLLGFIEQIINESKQGVRLVNNRGEGKKFSPVTIKGYNTTLNHLKEYQTKKRKKLTFENIDLNFYKDFLKYFNDQGYAPNTIGKNVKNIKVFMRESVNRGLTNNRSFEERDFKTLDQETEQIYLNETDLLKLYKLDLSNNKKLERVRDLFLIACFTGMRWGDWSNFGLKNIVRNPQGELVKAPAQKTGETVYIPLHWIVKEILNRYEGNLPRSITNQKFNEYLKELGELAEINEEVYISITRGGVRAEVKHKKYEMITTHTARRSFATNMYLNGIPAISIMKITGHKTEKSFLKYIRLSGEENANKLLEHPFFSPKSNLKKVK